MKEYYSFVYLDSTVIDDLYPQVFEDDAIEIEVSKSGEETTNADINASFLNILGSKVDSSERTISSKNAKIITSTARKAQLLIKFFEGEELSVEKIIKKNFPLDESIFFVGKSTFFLKDIFDKRTGKSMLVHGGPYGTSTSENVVLNDDAVFVLETGDDEYVRRYKNGTYIDFLPDILEIMMHVSNVKIRKDVRHMTSVIRQKSSFNFFVFGELIHTNANFYKISPFAIWM